MGSIPIKRTRGVIDTPSNLNVAQKHDRKRRWDDGHRSENNSRGSRRRVGHDSVDTRRTQVAPAVPSFGWSLKNLKSDVNNSSGCSALVKNIANPCPSNQLGLTPQVRDEDTALVDEESVALLSGTTSSALRIEFKGRTSLLSTPADIAAWIAERKKRFPTKARIEQKRAEQEQRQGLLSKARRKASDAPQEPRIDKHQGQGRLPPATGQTKAGVDGKKGGWPGRGGRRAFAGSPSGGILPNPPLAGIISASGALIHSQKDAMDVCFTDNRLAQAKIMDSRSDDELGKSESVLMNNPASPESSFKLGLNLCYSSSSSESHSLGNNDLNGANDSDESLSAVSSSEASDSSSDDTSDAEYAVSISANTAADSIDVASEKQLALSCTGERHRLTDKFPTQLRGRGPPHLRPNFSLSSRSPAKLARRSGTKPTLYERLVRNEVEQEQRRVLQIVCAMGAEGLLQ